MNADKNFKFKTIRWPPTCYYNSLIKHENVLDISSDYFKIFIHRTYPKYYKSDKWVSNINDLLEC